MKTINLSESELATMLKHYQSEYTRYKSRVDKLKNLLESLRQELPQDNVSQAVHEEEDYLLASKVSPAQETEKQPVKQFRRKTKTTRAKQTTQKTEKQKIKKPSESKVIAIHNENEIRNATPVVKRKKYLPNKPEKRNEAILNFLKEKGVPLSSNDFIVYVKQNFNVEGLTAGEIRLAINKLLNDLVFKNQILKKQYIPSENTHYYGLKEWFTKDNVLTNEYMKKLENYLKNSVWTPQESGSYTAEAQ